MTSSLSSRQGIVTKASSRLSVVLQECDDVLKTRIELPTNEAQRREYSKVLQQKIRKAKTIIQSEINNADCALDKYVKTADDLSPDVPRLDEILQKVKSNSEAAQELLQKARTAVTTLNVLYEELQEAEECRSDFQSTKMAKIKLAPIPIPKFTGKIWEWETFWGAFEHSVHSQDIDDLYKMNYLLDALQGEAKESIKQFEISRQTYPLVVAHLKEKYGNTQSLVDQLLRNAQMLRARSDRLEDQQKLYEQLFSLTSQLQLKGEHIDNSFFQKLLLGKFSEPIQRHILRQKQQLSTETWDTRTLLATAKDYIEAEIRISKQVEKHYGNINEFANSHFKKEYRPNSSIRKQSKGDVPCFYCNKSGHPAKNCDAFPSREERLEIMKKNKLCHNCGSRNHATPQCTKGNCTICSKHGHHTSICMKAVNLKNPQQSSTKPPLNAPPLKPQSTAKKIPQARINLASSINEDKETTSTTLNFTTIKGSNDTMILTGRAQVLNPATQSLESIYVLLDTGADRSFIKEELADRLQLKDMSSEELTITTFGCMKQMKKCGVTSIQMWDQNGAPHIYRVTRIPRIMETRQQCKLTKADREYLFENNIRLSIDMSTTDVEPQVLLGCADLFSLLEKGFSIQQTLPSGVQVVPSKLGYLVTGRKQEQKEKEEEERSLEKNDHTSDVLMLEAGYEVNARNDWERFCTFEASGVQEFLGPKGQEQAEMDEKIWKKFTDTIQKKEDGYYVQLPWKEGAENLPDNKRIAMKRLHNTMEKLKNNPVLLQQYHDTMMNQLESQIIEEVDELTEHGGRIIHYLAHQAILTPHKNTTKLRVVFDASAHHKNCPSLNDMLNQGPVMLPLLCDLLHRFRVGDIAILSDVEKAFLQVRLQEDDRDATRFLWVRHIDQPLSPENLVTYRFTRVTFGLNCSPFLLAGTLRHHLLNYSPNTDLAKHILENTYVDNVILTASSETEALDLYANSKKMFAEMNMNLREFCSNSCEVNARINQEDRSSNLLQKVLGIPWNTEKDELTLTCTYPPKKTCTKRSISEQVAAVYDPHGWLTPLTLKGKQFLQQLWKEGYEWDTNLSINHQQQWNEIVRNAEGFQRRTPRKIAEIGQSARLVVFADASAQAMATCAYLVSNNVAHLVAGKSKLPAIKENSTIPKLELNALTMATRLALSIYNAIRSKSTIENIIILSDSEVTLSWISKIQSDRTAGVLVRNRTREIRDIVKSIPIPVSFGYVPTCDNPADCGTRGVTKDEFENHIWWTGPTFITTPTDEWPNKVRLMRLPNESEENDNNDCSSTPVRTSRSAESQPSELLDWKRHNKLSSCQTTVANVLHFIRMTIRKLNPKSRTRIERNIPELSPVEHSPFINAIEREKALAVIIKNHQKTYFSPQHLKVLKQLNPQLDENNILRCRGRLNNAHLSRESRQPVLIASKTNLAKMIIEDAHTDLHCGTGHTMANVRQKYWIPKLRQQVKKIIKYCIPCQKMNNLPYRYPDMDDLPKERVTRTRPFENVGIDYFGPITAKNDDVVKKFYGIIITCETTRLIHIELVIDMTTTHLLHSLRRFFARRGVPKSIISDNGQYFLLGDEILRNAVLPVIDDPMLAKTMATKGITWKTITPYAPWQGAFYERLIKSIKYSLYKVMSGTQMTREELETLLIEIEASLNSRPLTYQEENFEEIPILRPVDFIQRDIIVTYPFKTESEENGDSSYLPSEELILLRTRKQTEAALKSSYRNTERFWTIWNKYYLSSLRESHKLTMSGNTGQKLTPSKDKVVLIADPILPRNTWKIGRITDVKISHNNVIREAEVRLPNGRKIKRPVNLLIPLEIDDDDHAHKTKNMEDPGNDSKKMTTNGEHESDGITTPSPRYDFRPRKKTFGDSSHQDQSTISMTSLTTSLLIMSVFQLLLPTAAGHFQNPHNASIKCTDEGVELTSTNVKRYELCIENLCSIKENPPLQENLNIEPELTLHQYTVRWKTTDGKEVLMIEKTCAPAPFCQKINCWLCTANVLNPHCSPKAAIAAATIVIYLTTMSLYLAYQSLRFITRPCHITIRILFSLCMMCPSLLRCLFTLLKEGKRRRYAENRTRYDVSSILDTPIIAITIVGIVCQTEACQEINVFTHHTKSCSLSPKGGQLCKITLNEVLKLNTFNQEACIRLISNKTMIQELRFKWRGLHLKCVKENIMFTRHTKQEVIDSKRCAHTGSCVKKKCEQIHHTARIPELHKGNIFPGKTYCVESCGGPGCGCFYLSSGCLFYRIFNVPLDRRVYELFKCPHWEEEVRIQISVTTPRSEKRMSVSLKPTIPQNVGKMRITFTSISTPPNPVLSATFVSNGEEIAIWTKDVKPNLLCGSLKAARDLHCTINDNCVCQPAENKINCACYDPNIASIFTEEVENRLPIERPWITLKKSDSRGSSVLAVIPTFVTAEVIVQLDDQFDESETVVSNADCRIPNTIATGCYNCLRGAVAKVSCTTTEEATMATVECDKEFFTVPCHKGGIESNLRFHHTEAKIKKVCQVSCGTLRNTFEITGVLQWTQTIHDSARKILKGESSLYNELTLPDFKHIFEILSHWYKEVVIAAAALTVALIAGYLFVWSYGLRILCFTIRLLWLPIRLATRCLRTILYSTYRCMHSQEKSPTKNL